MSNSHPPQVHRGPKKQPLTRTNALRLAGVFSGLGGLERGLTQARAIEAEWMCEIWEPARAVLSERLPGTPIASDIREVGSLPDVDVLAAGFPCTDLSPAGHMAGLEGSGSGLILTLLDLLGTASSRPTLILENVPNMLTLHRGAAIRTITDRLEALGYRWAYRTVDSRFTGLPQRRLRVVLMASANEQPQDVLFGENEEAPTDADFDDGAYGFYWTEGRGGLGWARDAIPTLKGGSTIGIASSPAIWHPEADRGHRLVTPSIADGERLQGFPVGWTDAATRIGGRDHRWKLIGNAVTVPVAAWLGERLLGPTSLSPDLGIEPLERDGRWPPAAWFDGTNVWSVGASAWPRRSEYRHLAEFIDFDSAQPLSHRATLGFLKRLDHSGLRVDPRFVMCLEDHLRAMRSTAFTRAPRSETSMVLPAGSAASSPAARRRMQANRSKNTRPELRVRRELHRRGLRYRLHTKADEVVRNRLDIVFRRARVAVEIRGCFWHACPEHGTKPKANADRWKAKLERNRERDLEVASGLSAIGWDLIVVWEHEDPVQAADRIERTVRSRVPA